MLTTLVRSFDPDGVTYLYSYNGRGEREVEALDMNRNGLIDYAGTDRIVKTSRSVAQRGGDHVERVTVSRWEQNGVNAATGVALSETTPNGRRAWSTQFGQLTTSETTLQGAGATTTTIVHPDNSGEVQRHENGRLLSSVRKDANAVPIGAETYTYADRHKRLTASIDARDGATAYTYEADDQISSVTTPDPDGAGPLAAQTTTFYYAAGRKWKEVQPDGAAVFFEYHLTGALWKQYGSRAYPVEYTYDPQGRLRTLQTRQGNPAGGEATTAWNYHPVSGFLTSKAHADGRGPLMPIPSVGESEHGPGCVGSSRRTSTTTPGK